MAHVTSAIWAPAEASFGQPVQHTWSYPITEPEMDMVISSTRGQIRLHDVTLFIFGPDGQLALIRKHAYQPGAWRTPGGGVHPGESFSAGAVREALEETGLEVDLTRYLLRVNVTFICGARTQPWTTHVMLAKAGKDTLSVHDPKEIAGVKWGSLDELCGPVAQVLLATGRGLFRYRAALHEEVRRLLQESST